MVSLDQTHGITFAAFSMLLAFGISWSHLPAWLQFQSSQADPMMRLICCAEMRQ
jgi:hypothetical protein